jgi:glycosyltransferase involved in cell wall biosynthesis
VGSLFYGLHCSVLDGEFSRDPVIQNLQLHYREPEVLHISASLHVFKGAPIFKRGKGFDFGDERMQDGGVIFFDLTQLILRVSDPTPDGIGRVELAYAQHLLANYPERVRFIFALPRLVQVIPARVAARYVKTIEMVWRQEDNISDTVVKELKAFLSTDDSFLNYSERQDRSRRFQRLSMVANLLMGSALQVARPRNLGRYSHSNFANAYVCVSNSTVSSKWLIRWLARSPSVAGIFLLHDIIPISNPEFTLPAATIRHQCYVRRVAESARTIIVNSAYTRDCLEKYAVSANLLLPEVVVAPLGVEAGFIRDPAFRPSEPYPTTPYFVFTATIEPRKNHMMLLQVWQRLVDKLGPDCPKLLLIGRRGRPPFYPKTENTFDRACRKPAEICYRMS